MKTLQIFIICLAALAAYSNTFDAPFTFDDEGSIIDNPFIRDLSYFTDISKTRGFAMWSVMRSRYMGYLSFALNYSANGYDVTGYHVVNLLIHILTSLLVFYFVTITFKTPFLRGSTLTGRSTLTAFLAALLFAVHPVQTQAVTYIVQRMSSMAALFYVLALTGYVRGRISPTLKGRIAFFCIGVLAAVLAFNTKQNTFTLPLAVVLYELLFFKGSMKNRLLWISLVLLAGLTIVLVFLPNPIAMLLKVLHQGDRPFSTHVLTQLRVIATYLRLFAFPMNLNIDYDYPLVHSLVSLSGLLPLALCVSLLGLGIVLTRYSSRGEPALRVIAFGIFFFFIALSIESLVVRLHPIYEHRLYLPSLGIFMGFAVLTIHIVEWTGTGFRRRVAFAAAAVLCSVLAIATFNRNEQWKSNITLWEDTVAKSPWKSRTHLNLGKAYDSAGRSDEALKEFEEAVELEPGLWDAHYILGTAYFERMKMGLAVKHYERAASLNPNDVRVLLNLGIGYLYNNQLDLSIKTLKRALELNPYYPDIHINLSIAYTQKGDAANSNKHSEAARRLRQRAR